MKRLIELLERYNSNSPEQQVLKTQILQFIRSNPENCLLRSNLVAHLTASAWVIDRQEQNRALLIRHAKLNRWLQPGGHADGDPDLVGVAIKEVAEETGISICERPEEIFDLDVHLIPFHQKIPPHLHLDVRFLLPVDATLPITLSDESHDIGWICFEEIPSLGVDESVLRLLKKSAQL